MWTICPNWTLTIICKYAPEQDGDMDAEYFLDCIGELYKLEAEYEKGQLSQKPIKNRRNRNLPLPLFIIYHV